MNIQNALPSVLILILSFTSISFASEKNQVNYSEWQNTATGSVWRYYKAPDIPLKNLDDARDLCEKSSAWPTPPHLN